MTKSKAQKLARAKTLILEWYDANPGTQSERSRLSVDISRFFQEIAEREAWSECMSVLLDGDRGTRNTFTATGKYWRADSAENGIFVSTVVPGWGFGWRSILEDDFTYETLSWLGHYARQYIHRSYVARALMISFERDGTILHPFGSLGFSSRYGPCLPAVSPKEALKRANNLLKREVGAPASSSRATRSKWCSRNTLDPAIHEAISHFLRGHSLLNDGYELESLVAFDCVIQSLQSLGWPCNGGNPRHSRPDFCNFIGLGNSATAVANEVYFLRNNFAAHPGGQRWWDWNEVADEEIVRAAARLANRALQRAADLEPEYRRIEPCPSVWSDWFVDHFPLIWRAVWFKRR